MWRDISTELRTYPPVGGDAVSKVETHHRSTTTHLPSVPAPVLPQTS